MSAETKWLPTPIKKILESFSFSSSEVLKKNLAYNIQYLQYLNKNVQEEETTTALCRIKYKMFVVVSMAVIESIFITLLDERDFIPVSEWKEKGKHKHKVIDDNIMIVSYQKKRVKPYKKSIQFDEAIYLIEKNKILPLKSHGFDLIRNLQELRNHLHLNKACELVDSDYNKFDEFVFNFTKTLFYYIMCEPIISRDTEYLEFLRPVKDYKALVFK